MDHSDYYAKWERKSQLQQISVEGKVNSARIQQKPKTRPLQLPSHNAKERSLSYASQRSLPAIPLKKESACSSRCKHLPNTAQILVKDTDNVHEPSPDVIQLLEFQIKARRNCILECKKQIVNLIEENIRLKNEIEGTDSKTHDNVNQQLRKYHKLQGAIGTITREHSKHVCSTEKEFEKVKNSTEKSLSVLEKDLERVEAAVNKQQKNLKTLLNYKDKEYPEKVRRIKHLKKELEILQDVKVTEMSEINRVIDIETQKYVGSATEAEIMLLDNIRSDVLDTMNREVKEKAIQNIQFRKEIDIHLKERERLLNETEVLEDKIRKILLQDKPVMQRKLFPGVFIDDDKCSPDTELVLRIPKQEFIPL